MHETRGRILCIEPSSDICEMVQRLLRERGYETDSAGTLADAVAKARHTHYVLFIVDDYYPDGTNTELVTRLRALAPLTPIIVFSAVVFERDRQAALDAGANLFLSKPEGIIELSPAIAHLLQPAR